MALQTQSPTKHNQMLGRFLQKGLSGKEHDYLDERPTKRQRRSGFDDDGHEEDLAESTPSPPKPRLREIPVPDTDSNDEGFGDLESTQLTDLESALPAIKTDKEAIEEYEAQRVAQNAEMGLEGRMQRAEWVKGRTSIYVDAFNLALDTVLEEESHLFDAAEIGVFHNWKALSYEAQYLYVRLFLRKTSAWHRIRTLGYHSDIANLESPIEELQWSRDLPETRDEVHQNPGELETPEGTTLGRSFTFADHSDEHIKTLEEASVLLRLDELKAIARDVKAQGKNKKELLASLRRTSGNQSALGFLRREETEESIKSNDAELDNKSRNRSPTKENRDAYFVQKILAETGPCIRLTSAPLKLFERVHLVFYRSTEWTEKSLTTIILARIARRNFPEYIVSRSANIFSSRTSLLEFEASIRTQFRVDDILEFNGTPNRQGLQTVLDIFEEIYPRWAVLLQEEQRKEDSVYSSGEGAYLRRLSPAWVYTRIIHKGADVLGKFKQHKREHEILTELLNQRLFHPARRGAWYQRKALLEEHYMSALYPSEGRTDDAQRKHWKQIALQTCEDGLQDNHVTVIYHYDLQKRILKLERALKIAKRFQHDFGHVRLAKPVERTFEGTRIERSPPPATLPKSMTSTVVKDPSTTPSSSTRRGGRTIWVDPASPSDSPSHCSVEEMCLSNYRDLGYRGYHSEGGVLRTLFAYLFYDILFTYVPNVFQTPYQTCPLDLHSDAFYPTRLGEVNRRLAEISNGLGRDIVKRIWDEHYERKTCVVGLDWSFDIADLLEIVGIFGGEALSTCCKVLAQEYGQRGGGVPDLFLWKKDELGKGEVMFAEVKSENDRLSDTQRLWIHVLTGAGIKVELCNAIAKEVRHLG
ncbi:hypothetical protein EV356DRAFT_466674 [Viridothelium virens]|uniref:Fanconi-associated nuclease n=1 Tax=Viridothelium virens TaxID=1048519 RepID=A0A6A6H945_VIRVR|nr:hypothetical protein EV356DRAFT_466674 [Viridothelium virens]